MLEVAFISNLGPPLVIVPVLLLPVVSILFALGLQRVLRKSSGISARIGAVFFGTSFVELLVGAILAPSIPGGYFTVSILAVALLSVALVTFGFAQWKSTEFPKWNASLAFVAVAAFWILSPLMSTSLSGLLAFSGRFLVFAAWIFATAGFQWRAGVRVAALAPGI